MTPAIRRGFVRSLQVAIVAYVLWRAGAELTAQWNAFRARGGTLAPDWPPVLLATLLVLSTYALLAHAWRALVSAAGTPLPFAEAARIWSVSNLGRYVPGKVWSIAAMGVLARRAGLAPVAATAAALLGTLVNIAAGFAVLLAAGLGVGSAAVPGAARPARIIGVLAAIGLLLLPWLLPGLVRLAARLLRRDVTVPELPRRTLAWVVVANVVAWIGYGLAFRVLALAFFPGSAGNWLGYLAVFTGSYLAGYLALIVPGGLGVREGAMVAGLVALGLTGSAEAWVLAFASRLWLTVLELVPGLVFLARDASLRASVSSPDVPS